jgi:hypothetical protein
MGVSEVSLAAKIPNAEGWAIILDGREGDLLDWESALPPPFSPWVEQYIDPENNRFFLLRSASFPPGAADHEQIRDISNTLVGRLNGVLAAVESSGAVGRGSGMYFRADGKIDRAVFPVTGHFKITLGRVRVSSTGTTGGPPEPPRPSEAQQWAALSYATGPGDLKRADMIADLLDHLARPDSWYDAYKVIEIASRLCGRETTLFSHPFSKAARAKLLKRTANHYRHAPGESELPPNAPSLEETVAGSRQIAIGVLRMIAAGVDPTRPSKP